MLRDTLNCTLPIEIIYNGPGEMDDWAINKFQARSLRPPLYSQRQFKIHATISELYLFTSQPQAPAHLHGSLRFESSHRAAHP